MKTQWTSRVVTDIKGEPVTMSRTAVSLEAASLAPGDDRGVPLRRCTR